MSIETFTNGIDFFSDQFLDQEISRVISSVDRARNNHNIHKNVIDPFAAIFEAGLLGQTPEEWIASETARQVNKALSNAIGAFHQNLLGNLPGWENTGAIGGGYDLKHATPFGSTKRPVIAEVKNKFNTQNSGGQSETFNKFGKALELGDFRGYQAMMIQVIQKKLNRDIPWKVGRNGVREDIRIIDAAGVYALSTGDADAFKKTYAAISRVLDERFEIYSSTPDNTTFIELFKKATEIHAAH